MQSKGLNKLFYPNSIYKHRINALTQKRTDMQIERLNELFYSNSTHKHTVYALYNTKINTHLHAEWTSQQGIRTFWPSRSSVSSHATPWGRRTQEHHRHHPVSVRHVFWSPSLHHGPRSPRSAWAPCERRRGAFGAGAVQAVTQGYVYKCCSLDQRNARSMHLA